MKPRKYVISGHGLISVMPPIVIKSFGFLVTLSLLKTGTFPIRIYTTGR